MFVGNICLQPIWRTSDCSHRLLACNDICGELSRFCLLFRGPAELRTSIHSGGILRADVTPRWTKQNFRFPTAVDVTAAG
jgi:hypothetical protein